MFLLRPRRQTPQAFKKKHHVLALMGDLNTFKVKQGQLKDACETKMIAVFLNALVISDSFFIKYLLHYHYTSETENGQRRF